MKAPSTLTRPCLAIHAAGRHVSLAGPWLAAVSLLPNALAQNTTYEERLARLPQPESSVASEPYTLKRGDFRILASTSLGIDWNDNVRVSDAAKEDDLILRPSLNLRASYPITANNVLRLNLGVGYDQYLDHNELSTWRLDSGTALSFDIAVKDFVFNIHDRVAYVRNGARTGDTAGAAEQGTLENTAGVSARWLGGDVLIGSGFDHVNAWSVSDQYEYQDRATEIVPLQVGLRLHPQLLAGLEGSAAFTAYALPILNDSSAYNVGAYAEWTPGTSLQIVPRVGFSIYDFRQTSVLIQAEDADSWYADLTLTHQPRDAFRYSLSAGHELRLGLQSDLVEAWFIKPGLTWFPNQRMTVHGNLFWETGTQGASQLGGVSNEDFDWYGFDLKVLSPVTKNLSASVGYRLTLRSSNSPGRDYQQNVVSLALTYTFQ